MGRVKTRLAGGLGVSGATAFYRNETRSLIRRLRQDLRWRTVLAVTPDVAAFESTFPETLSADLPRLTQGQGGLDARMMNAFRLLPPGPALIIGSDIPGIGSAHIAEAFKALGSHDVVFGPADDGGYWLVGQKRVPKVLSMFADVRWSTKDALADTIRSLPRGTSVAEVATLTDVDTIEDYRRVMG